MKETRYVSLTSHYSTMHDLCTTSRMSTRVDHSPRFMAARLASYNEVIELSVIVALGKMGHV